MGRSAQLLRALEAIRRFEAEEPELGRKRRRETNAVEPRKSVFARIGGSCKEKSPRGEDAGTKKPEWNRSVFGTVVTEGDFGDFICRFCHKTKRYVIESATRDICRDCDALPQGRCFTCGTEKPRDAFSKTQWRGKRRCQGCVGPTED